MALVCRRCGRCCHYMKNNKLVPCKFLVTHGTTTSCRIYGNHVGTIIDKELKQVCHDRKDVHKNYDGCPYNRPEWAIFLFFLLYLFVKLASKAVLF